MKLFNRFAFTFLLVLSCKMALLAQVTTIKNSIVIKNNHHPEKETFYKEAIYRSEMENFRLREKDVVLKFSDGFECVMLSAKTLKEKGENIDLNNYQMDFIPKFVLPIFTITQEGMLVASYEKVIK